MLPKRLKEETSSRLQEDNEDLQQNNINPTSEANSQKKKDGSFKCHCGKAYGSLAAVHTHINNKHTDQKKKYKNLIVNPKKVGQGPSTSIRMKDINFPEREAEHMCLADNTVKTIYEYMKAIYEKAGKKLEILLDDHDLESDSELDSDQIEGIRENQKRKDSIKNQMDRLCEQSQIAQLRGMSDSYEEFRPFKIEKFTLSLDKELTKYFKPLFAARIQLQLLIAATKKRPVQSSLSTRMIKCERILWEDVQQMAEHIEAYYSGWLKVASILSHVK